MTARPSSRRASVNIPEDDLRLIMDAIQLLQEKLQPHLVDLGPEELRRLSRMGPRTVAFVNRALVYAQLHPEFRPAFVDVDELARDLAAVDTLRSILSPLSLLAGMVNDSLVQSGSQAFGASRAWYQAVKNAAKLGHPGATLIVQDLGRRFAAPSPKRVSAPPSSDTGTPQRDDGR
jgi:hypothetical protein